MNSDKGILGEIPGKKANEHGYDFVYTEDIFDVYMAYSDPMRLPVSVGAQAFRFLFKREIPIDTSLLHTNIAY